jgi:hypothetical protein
MSVQVTVANPDPGAMTASHESVLALRSGSTDADSGSG